jgi:hypothetical protein
MSEDILYVASYEIHPNKSGGYSVVRGGQVLTQQATKEEAIAIAEKWGQEDWDAR